MNSQDHDYIKEGEGKFFLKDLAGALELFEKAVLENPDNGEAYNNLGFIKGEQKRFAEAIIDLNKSIDCGYRTPIVYLNRARINYYLEQYQSTVEDCNKVISLEPNNAIAYGFRGGANYYLKNIAAAIVDLTKSITLDPEEGEAYSTRGAIYYSEGKIDEAVIDLECAITKQKGNAGQAYYYLGNIRFDSKEYQVASELFDKAIASRSDVPKYYYARGKVHEELGNYSKAIEDMSKVIELDHTNEEAFLSRSNLKGLLGDEKGRFEDLDRYISISKIKMGEDDEDTDKRTSIPDKVRKKVWQRDGGKCVQCGSRNNLEYDHIIPFSRGGGNTERNIQLLCEKCNRSKSNQI